MSQSLIRVERDGAVTVVRFARPQAANAVSIEFLNELEAVAHGFRDDVATRVVVFTGEGRHFCAGADLKAPADAYGTQLLERQRKTRSGERAIEALLGIDALTIAAWNGAAMGGGACIAAALDLRIAATDAICQYPEVLLGMNLMWRSLPLTVRRVGAARAIRLVAGGERIDALQMLDWGLADRLVEPDQLMTGAMAWADSYAAKPPIAVQMIKRSINAISGAMDAAVMHMDADQNLLTSFSTDRPEAARSYLAGRDGDFSGD